LRLELGHSDVTADALMLEAEHLQISLGHREVWIEDPELGEELAPAFTGAGWKVNRHVIMAHKNSGDRRPDTSEVRPVGETEVWPSRAEFLRTYEWCRDDATVAQMHAAYRIWIAAGNGIDLAISRDGRPVSFAMLWRDGDTAQIEDVATLEPYRNQGLSSAVIVKALEQARADGCTLVFLIADEDDWPKLLYAKLGFEPVGTQIYFVKVNS
jgi:GNAT superfamily N-acetyltransferase